MTQRDEGHHNGEITSEQLEYFLGSDHTNKQKLLDEIISLLNKEVDIDVKDRGNLGNLFKY